MISNLSAHHLPDEVALWRSLRDYLKVDVEVDVPDSPEPNSNVTVKFTVTNTAPVNEDWPEIEFEDASLRVGTRTQGTGRLPSGGSASIEHSCRFAELPDIGFQVEGSVSRKKFFRVQKSAEIPKPYARPSVLAFLTAFNEIEVHRALDSTSTLIEAIEPDTRLTDIHAINGALTNLASDTEDMQSRLNEPSRIINGPQFTAHLKTVYAYLNGVRDTCLNLKNAFSSANPDEISAAKSAVDALKNEATEINRATEALMQKYDVSDAEVNYQYRGR